MLMVMRLILKESIHPKLVSLSGMFISQSFFCTLERTSDIKEKAEAHLHPMSEFADSEDWGEDRRKVCSGSQNPTFICSLGCLHYF